MRISWCAASVLPRVACASAILLGLALAVVGSDLASFLVAVGASVVVPIGASLSLRAERDGGESMDVRAATGLVGLGSLAFALSMVVPDVAIVSTGAAALHLVGTLSLAWAAARRLAVRGGIPLDELAIDAGSMMLPVGAAFALASRARFPLLGFEEPIVTFTAAHFHYAGFAAPVVIGCVGRLGQERSAPTRARYRLGTSAVIAGVPLTALGILFGATIERIAAVLLAAGLLVASIDAVATVVAGKERPFAPRALLGVAFAGLVVPMGLAATFALTGSAGRGRGLSEIVSLATMIRYHGAINALVFALPALVACRVLDTAPRHAAFGFPLSRLRGGLHIGGDFFARIGAVSRDESPSGIVDRLEVHAHPRFDAASVHPDVRAFYEHTSTTSLEVTPTWSRPFRLPGRIWRRIARAIGQVALPIEAANDDRVASEVVGLEEASDGRPGARGWIRTYASSGEALYVAAYAATPSFGRVLMNIAFPLPFSALISVLRFEDGATPGSLRVTTCAESGDLVSDEGIYLATRFITFRLPMHEWVDVRPTDVPGVTEAVHELFLCGHRYLRLDYRITTRSAGSTSR